MIRRIAAPALAALTLAASAAMPLAAGAAPTPQAVDQAIKNRVNVIGRECTSSQQNWAKCSGLLNFIESFIGSIIP